MASKFLSAEREDSSKIDLQNQEINNDATISSIVKAIPFILLILNDKRQIVYYNESLVNSIGGFPSNKILGLRPGEFFNCQHAYEEEGCGTTEFCTTCGAAKAIISGLAGRNDVQECRIIKRQSDALDLRVWTSPIVLNGHNYTLFTLIDISNEKRRLALERIFFHDILNTAGGIQGFAELLPEASPEELIDFSKTIAMLADKLIDEINSQKELMLAELNELKVNKTNFYLFEVVDEVHKLYEFHPVSFEKKISVIHNDKSIKLISDKTLLRRVIGNLTKNALEASKKNGVVSISYKKIEDHSVEISVHNETYIPREVQLQIFQRSFSTKGAGRGLGTYSIKLLTERYLNGRVSFISDKNSGTTFTILVPLEI